VREVRKSEISEQRVKSIHVAPTLLAECWVSARTPSVVSSGRWRLGAGGAVRPLPTGGTGEVYGEVEFVCRLTEHFGANGVDRSLGSQRCAEDGGRVREWRSAEVNRVLSRLAGGYADLFGKPELA
jgi:hypothetical protein